ncbi:EutP/PduV family microcompartment system protein [Paludibacterium paludis]|uniref:Ethanolamine utilization protein EutP n=1 Tax=Paludibacterium paludis TaxID=1225769 RepID=A0A918U797_9NEIS|nr:EutP/PduV family microcompartment system protein [Paludibacterium paludis]GGY02333.1 ethanolamine utilization protein EutP [Paludibacterium paludis]
MSTPVRFALVGPVEAGKSTLFRALHGDDGEVRKTQAVEYDTEGCIDTPGEFFCHPRLHHALINSTADCDLLIYVHPANDMECRLPPGLLDVYAQRRLVTVISKTDLPDARPDAVEAMLRDQGIGGEILRVSGLEPDSVAALKTRLGLNRESAAKPRQTE